MGTNYNTGMMFNVCSRCGQYAPALLDTTGQTLEAASTAVLDWLSATGAG